MDDKLVRHYCYDKNEVMQMFLSMGYDVELLLNADFMSEWWISQIVSICMQEYKFIDCETHVNRYDYYDDVKNGMKEDTIFNLLAVYTETQLHELNRDEIVSDIIVLDNTNLEIVIHDLSNDNRTNYLLKC